MRRLCDDEDMGGSEQLAFDYMKGRASKEGLAARLPKAIRCWGLNSSGVLEISGVNWAV